VAPAEHRVSGARHAHQSHGDRQHDCGHDTDQNIEDHHGQTRHDREAHLGSADLPQLT
jgi:hypothetical protein